MIHFFQPFVLQLNPDGINASIEYFYKHVHQNIPLSFSRSSNNCETIEVARATVLIGHRQVLAVAKYSMTCASLKLFLTARINISAYAIDFYKLGNDGITITLIGSKVLQPQRG